MATLNKNLLLGIVTLVCLIALPIAFSGAPAVVTSPVAVPLLLGIEILVYFIAALAMNPKATVGMAIGTALVFAVLRAVCALLGGVLATVLFPALPSEFETYHPWLNPGSGLLQALLLVFAGPYLLALAIPELIGREEALGLRGERPGPSPARSSLGPGTAPMETVPTGGFIQVFSFEELAGVIKKCPGLEGFIIYNEEALVVWEDLPVNLDTDRLTPLLVTTATGLGALMIETGVGRTRRLLVDCPNHQILLTTLNQTFGLILFFNGRTPPDEVHGRISMLARTAREFLQWKYPGLPLATHRSTERNQVSMV